MSSSGDDNNKTVTLTTSDGDKFEVEVSLISQSQTIKHMIEDDCANEFIPVPNVEGKVLAQVIEYFKKHHKSSADVVVDENTKKEIREWDIEFVTKMDFNSLADLTLAANYLNNKDLLDLTTQKIANDIKDKTAEEARDFFNIKYDFARGEEWELKKTHGYTFAPGEEEELKKKHGSTETL